jgi:hypothetical protein
MILDLSGTPSWLFGCLAGVTALAFLATVFWIMPSRFRRGAPGRSVGIAGLLLTSQLLVQWNRPGSLWIATLVLAPWVPPLLWLGKLPPDMPAAADPSVAAHPMYREIHRRGRRAGLAGLGMLLVTLVVGLGLVKTP